jgi:hypothetical protein
MLTKVELVYIAETDSIDVGCYTCITTPIAEL